MQLEFFALARHSGRQEFHEKAQKVIDVLDRNGGPTDSEGGRLWPIHIRPDSGKLTGSQTLTLTLILTLTLTLTSKLTGTQISPREPEPNPWQGAGRQPVLLCLLRGHVGARSNLNLNLNPDPNPNPNPNPNPSPNPNQVWARRSCAARTRSRAPASAPPRQRCSRRCASHSGHCRRRRACSTRRHAAARAWPPGAYPCPYP